MSASVVRRPPPSPSQPQPPPPPERFIRIDRLHLLCRALLAYYQQQRLEDLVHALDSRPVELLFAVPDALVHALDAQQLLTDDDQIEVSHVA